MSKAIVLLVALTILTPAFAWASEVPNSGGEDAQATTFNSGKSNSDNRESGAGEGATTVKGSKSNTSDRAAGAGATTVKGSKSNSSE